MDHIGASSLMCASTTSTICYHHRSWIGVPAIGSYTAKVVIYTLSLLISVRRHWPKETWYGCRERVKTWLGQEKDNSHIDIWVSCYISFVSTGFLTRKPLTVPLASVRSRLYSYWICTRLVRTRICFWWTSQMNLLLEVRAQFPALLFCFAGFSYAILDTLGWNQFDRRYPVFRLYSTSQRGMEATQRPTRRF
jgi:hypothetical protein